jgi:hypothetical protein
MTVFRSTRLRARLVPGLILLLLLAQGLRLCLPVATPEQPAQAVHLESLLTTVADQHESNSSGDVDLSLDIAAKVADPGPAFAALQVFAVVLFLLLPPQSVPRPSPGTFVFRPPRGHGFLPPTRAPPR